MSYAFVSEQTSNYLVTEADFVGCHRGRSPTLSFSLSLSHMISSIIFIHIHTFSLALSVSPLSLTQTQRITWRSTTSLATSNQTEHSSSTPRGVCVCVFVCSMWMCTRSNTCVVNFNESVRGGMDMDEQMDSESLYPTSGPLLRHWMSICLEALNGKSQRKVFPLSRIHTHILISHTLERAYKCTHTTHT